MEPTPEKPEPGPKQAGAREEAVNATTRAVQFGVLPLGRRGSTDPAERWKAAGRTVVLGGRMSSLSTALRADQQLHARSGAKSPLVIDPRRSRLLGRWDLIASIALIFTALFTPFEVAFMRPSTSPPWPGPKIEGSPRRGFLLWRPSPGTKSGPFYLSRHSRARAARATQF